MVLAQVLAAKSSGALSISKCFLKALAIKLFYFIKKKKYLLLKLNLEGTGFFCLYGLFMF